jgi:hypothetical protein
MSANSLLLSSDYCGVQHWLETVGTYQIFCGFSSSLADRVHKLKAVAALPQAQFHTWYGVHAAWPGLYGIHG